MRINKMVASAVTAAILGITALTGCSGGNSSYDRVYDTRTHSYVEVSDSYYRSHRSYYSGKVTHVKHTKTTTYHSDGTKTVKHSTTKTTVNRKSFGGNHSRHR